MYFAVHFTVCNYLYSHKIIILILNFAHPLLHSSLPHFMQSKVPDCPLCGQPVSMSRSQGEDVNAQVERHIASGCRDHVVLPQPRRSTLTSCTHRGCRRRDLVPYTCPRCERVVCIRHRQPMDHPCLPPAIAVH